MIEILVDKANVEKATSILRQMSEVGLEERYPNRSFTPVYSIKEGTFTYKNKCGNEIEVEVAYIQLIFLGGEGYGIVAYVIDENKINGMVSFSDDRVKMLQSDKSLITNKCAHCQKNVGNSNFYIVGDINKDKFCKIHKGCLKGLTDGLLTDKYAQTYVRLLDELRKLKYKPE